MPTRKYKSRLEDLIAEGQRLVRQNAEARFIHRVTLVNLVLNGTPPSEISISAKESVSTITSWVKTVDEHGFDSLRIKKQPGRPVKLNQEQLDELQKIIEEDEPKKYGFNVWDGSSVQAFINSRFNISYSVRSCQLLLHKLGFSLIRPQSFPSKGYEDTDKREQFKKK